MEIGVDSFAALMPKPTTGAPPTPSERMEYLLEEIEIADRVGLDAFGLGEHHRADFIDSSPAVILAAGAARTRTIRLHSAVSVVSATDPVRVFEDFATLDLISGGRAEIIAGRGSFVDAHALFGVNLADYDAAFAEKLNLLLRLREANHITWAGRFRAPLSGQGVFPRPLQEQLPIWVGVGGTPTSFVRAGTLGVPLMLAVIGGTYDHFRPLVDLYWSAGQRAGHSADRLKVGLHVMGFVADTTEKARNTLFRGWHYMFTEMAKERGWHHASRADFDALAGPGGSYLVGDPPTVAAKIKAASDALGGLARVNVQMSAASGDRDALLRSVELLGTSVAPIVRDAARRVAV